MFIIDFDDTLFETEKYKLARMERLINLGVPEKVFWQSYDAARVDEIGQFAYSDERHAHILADLGYEREKMLVALQSVTKEMTNFLDSEALSFLSDLQDYGQSLVLLSLGDPSTQADKVTAVGIANYFTKIYLVKENKISVLGQLLSGVQSGETAWFINDKPQENTEVAAAFPKLKLVAKMSPRFTEEDYKLSGVPWFKTLSEIQDYIGINR